MPSKRNSTAPDSREPSAPRQPTEPVAPTRTRGAARPGPAPRPSRGAAAIPAPRKAELHRVPMPARPLPTREEIARRAYDLWEQSGCVCGRDAENWAQAERELSAGCSAQQS